MWVAVENETDNKYSYLDFKGKEDFVDEWFLMSTPAWIMFITMSYLLFVLKIGPESMKKRPPFNLNRLLLYYNGIQVFISCYILYKGIDLLWPYGLIHKHCMIDRQSKKKIATGIYIYLLAKISELLDTIFFVLRKKNNQISFLHVYHHCSMMVTSWLCLKYEPSLASIFLGTVNSFIHIIMYSYYGLSTLPSVYKYLWWKKYLTSLQLVQFVMVIIQALINYMYSPCPPSYALISAILFHASVFLYLFTAFYVKSYTKDNKSKTSRPEKGLCYYCKHESCENEIDIKCKPLRRRRLMSMRG